MTNIYELLSEEICSECLAGNEDCFEGCGDCRFWCEHRELKELCAKVEEVASGISHMARNYSKRWDRVAALGC